VCLGGSDSDVLLDLCYKVDKDKKITYVFFDTGIEYAATHEHLDFLEKKYDISILRYRPKKPVPQSCKEYGQPVFNKVTCEMLMRLQKYGFEWEDDSFFNLLDKYCIKADVVKTAELEEKLEKDEDIKHWAKFNGIWYKGCCSALAFWCNNNKNGGMYNISKLPFLKEFITENPPTFKISNKCCTYAKKTVSEQLCKAYGFDLVILGLRKAEGGARADAYKNCFSSPNKSHKFASYRPIFWYKTENKNIYKDFYNIECSRCYSEYKLTRTGCAGCPYGAHWKDEVGMCREYEPKLYKAITYIFKDSYAYMEAYAEYVKKRKMADASVLSDNGTSFAVGSHG